MYKHLIQQLRAKSDANCDEAAELIELFVTALPVIQSWVHRLSFMQQTVLIEVTRGPDGLTKYHKSKYLLRWYRRCLLLAAFERRVLETPYEEGGGSFTGPSYGSGGAFYYDPNAPWETPMQELVSEVIRGADEMPHHFYRHMMHAFEIMGYKHPDERIREFWLAVYLRLSRDLHLNPETEAQLDKRLGDSREDWAAAGDAATLA